MKKYNKLITDKRGDLIVFEKFLNLPFTPKRSYFIFPQSGNKRGFHSHKIGRIAVLCLMGSFNLILDDGEKKTEYFLSSYKEHVLIEPNCWHVLENFSDNCIIAVLASNEYDESDYIRSYEEFLEHIKNN